MEVTWKTSIWAPRLIDRL